MLESFFAFLIKLHIIAIISFVKEKKTRNISLKIFSVMFDDGSFEKLL